MWKRNVRKYRNSFQLSELVVLFRTVFMYCVDADYKLQQKVLMNQYNQAQSASAPSNIAPMASNIANQASAVANAVDSKISIIPVLDGINNSTSEVLDNSTSSPKNVSVSNMTTINEKDIFDDALFQHYPRCCFATLINVRHTCVMTSMI